MNLKTCTRVREKIAHEERNWNTPLTKLNTPWSDVRTSFSFSEIENIPSQCELFCRRTSVLAIRNRNMPHECVPLVERRIPQQQTHCEQMCNLLPVSRNLRIRDSVIFVVAVCLQIRWLIRERGEEVWDLDMGGGLYTIVKICSVCITGALSWMNS
jgi:hypothetical protein